MKYKIGCTDDYNYDDISFDENPARAAMAELIYTNHEQILKHLSNPSTNFDKVPSQNLISLISANLILNMFDNIVDTDSIKEKLAMANELIDMIKEIFLTCVMKDELSKPHEGNIN